MLAVWSQVDGSLKEGSALPRAKQADIYWGPESTWLADERHPQGDENLSGPVRAGGSGR